MGRKKQSQRQKDWQNYRRKRWGQYKAKQDNKSALPHPNTIRRWREDFDAGKR